MLATLIFVTVLIVVVYALLPDDLDDFTNALIKYFTSQISRMFTSVMSSTKCAKLISFFRVCAL